MKQLFLSGAIALAFVASAVAQAPVIVQPANQATTPLQPANAQKDSTESDVAWALKSLEEMKAANEEILKKQQAMLGALDQLQKDADQLRIFAKRS